jgi:molecular chaperone GrpE
MTDPEHESAAMAGADTSDGDAGSVGDPEAPEPDPVPDDPAVPAKPAREAPEGAAPTVDAPDLAPAPATAGETPSPVGEPDALLAAVQRLEAHVSAESGRILQAFGEKLAFDAFKEAQVERLHAEVQQHREGLLERTTRPLLNAVIRMHDDLGKAAASLRARPPGEITPERTFRLVDGFREDLELLLSQHGVEPFDPPGDVFDPRLHTALRTVDTHDPALAGRIAERLRPGFSHGDALLQKARVAVFTAQAAPPPAAPATPTAPPATGEEG